jgi:hypothetical protein
MIRGNGLHVSTRAISGALVHMRERVPTFGGQRGGGGGISTPKQRHFFQKTCAFFICQNHFYREIEELFFLDKSLELLCCRCFGRRPARPGKPTVLPLRPSPPCTACWTRDMKASFKRRFTYSGRGTRRRSRGAASPRERIEAAARVEAARVGAVRFEAARIRLEAELEAERVRAERVEAEYVEAEAAWRRRRPGRQRARRRPSWHRRSEGSGEAELGLEFSFNRCVVHLSFGGRFEDRGQYTPLTPSAPLAGPQRQLHARAV